MPPQSSEAPHGIPIAFAKLGAKFVILAELRHLNDFRVVKELLAAHKTRIRGLLSDMPVAFLTARVRLFVEVKFLVWHC